MSVSLIEEPIKTFLDKIQEHLDPKNKKTYLKKTFGEPEHAARIIQRYVRTYLLKKKLNENPYGYYLSCIDRHEETRFLSEMMFGMRQAALDEASLEYVSNPFMDIFSGYHRTNNRHEGPLMQMLLSEFKVVSDWYHYIPISQSRNAPFSDYLDAIKDKFPRLSNPVQWITSDKHNISILALSKQIDYFAVNRIRADISACGFVATLWEMAQNIKKTDTTSNLHFLEKSERPMWLPTCHEALFKSAIMGRLRMIAHDPNIVSQKLAQALLRLLKNTPQLSMQAIQRVSMMLEITHLFYANNYPKYAFCVYTVVHEISLALVQERSTPRIRKAYDEFLRESKQTFCNALEIEKTGLNTFAAPAMSGTNAYMLAIKLAHQLLLERPPTFKVVMTSYYEFENITPKSQQADDETDVFIISTGPILDVTGLVPGVDINLFIETHLGASRTIPATIIIDTTTTLYRNLRLNQKARELISTGKLLIIIHESRQKFGLLHTDQAQYGRIFGVCSPLCYKIEYLKVIEENGFLDFMSHIDMRVGAFLSVQCSDILEDIKLQHFKNGALMRSLLTHAIEVSDVIEHPLMSGGSDELYFLSFSDVHAELLSDATENTVDCRSSFGHFHTVKTWLYKQVRFSADASDVIDTLIKSTQIFIGFFYSLKCLVPILIKYSRLLPDSLTLAQQICFLAMLSNISLTMAESGFKQADMVKLYAAMANIIDKCQDLKARSYTSNVVQYLGIFRQAILDRLEIVSWQQTVINKLRLIYLINPSLINDKMLSLLKNKTYSYYSQPLLLHKKTNDAPDIGSINQPLSSHITGDLWHLLVKCKLYFMPENFPILLEPKIYALLWPDSEKELQSNPLTQRVSF